MEAGAGGCFYKFSRPTRIPLWFDIASSEFDTLLRRGKSLMNGQRVSRRHAAGGNQPPRGAWRDDL